MCEDEKETDRENPFWRAQPRWVRLLSKWVAFPAWLYLAVRMFSGEFPLLLAMPDILAIIVFAAICVIQTFFFLSREGFFD